MPNQPFLTVQKIASNCSEQENHRTKDLFHQLGLLSPNLSPKPWLPQQLCSGGRWSPGQGSRFLSHLAVVSMSRSCPEQPSRLHHGKDLSVKENSEGASPSFPQ